MRYRRFGRTGLQVSAVSLGGAYLGGGDPERAQENACDIVRRALDLGCNYIDTAPLYGESETLLGGALAGETRPFYVASKVGFKPEGFDYKRDSVLRSLECSLGLLGIGKLTVAQIHEVIWPAGRGLSSRGERWRVCVRRRSGAFVILSASRAGRCRSWPSWRRRGSSIPCYVITTIPPVYNWRQSRCCRRPPIAIWG